jgi:predicted  nucleic acid-binding Zn-ribbon protein
VQVREQIDALRRERATRQASVVRIDGEVRRLQAEAYAVQVDMSELDDQMRSLESEVGALWRDAQPALPGAPGKA